MTNSQWVLIFGEEEFGEGLVDIRIRSGVNQETEATGSLPIDFFVQRGADFSAEFKIEKVTEEVRQRLFTGIVDTISFTNSMAHFRCVTRTKLLDEARSGGWEFSRHMNFFEMAWSVLRAGGLGSEQIDIEDFIPGPLEVVEVVVPILGISLSQPVRIGNVTFSSSPHIKESTSSLSYEDLKSEFTDSDGWACVLQTSRTLFDAEVLGLQQIDLAISWLTLQSRHSFPVDANGKLYNFNRRWLRSHVARKSIVLSRGLGTKRGWLRATEDLPNRVDISSDGLAPLIYNNLPAEIPIEVRAAIVTWKRSLDDDNPLTSIVALWECIEFYASSAKTEKIFSKEERSHIVRNATEGLSPEKAARVVQVLEKLNESSLLRSLEAAIKRDGVPISPSELSLLKNIRQVRNDFVHGRTTSPPREEDLAYAKQITARILSFRVSQLARSSLATVSNKSELFPLRPWQ